MADNQGYVVSPLTVAPVKRSDTVLLPDGLTQLKHVARTVDPLSSPIRPRPASGRDHLNFL